eukprot:3576682-Prymnesium_polylepis.1
MKVRRAWQQALSAAECTEAHVRRLHAKLTLGRDERRHPDPLPTARARGTQPITTIARWKLGHATQDRMKVRGVWQQALSAAECADAHVGGLHNANPRS